MNGSGRNFAVNLRRALAASLCILLLPAPAGAADADAYAYAFALQTPGNPAAWQVELTPEVYAVATPDLHDVGVIDANGDAVPAAPYRAPLAAAADAVVDLPLFALPAPPSGAADNDAIRLQIERGDDGRLRRVAADVGAPTAAATAGARADLLLDASAVHDAFSAVRLDWTATADVSAQFEVAGSDDLQQWRVLVARATVLHLTQGGNSLDRHEIGLDHAHSAYLRLRRLDDGAALTDLKVRLRTASPSSATRSARQWLVAAATASEARSAADAAASADRPPVFLYRLPAALPVEALKLELVDDNSLARVGISSRERRADAEYWQPRAGMVAFRLVQDGVTIGNDEVALAPAATAQDWRVEPATPLAHAPKLSVAYLPQRLVFLAQGRAPYRLVAGSAAARRGDYPVDAALATLRGSQAHDWQPPLATLGSRTTLAGERALQPAPQPRDWKTWLLWAVLIGAALLIGALALSLLKGSARRH